MKTQLTIAAIGLVLATGGICHHVHHQHAAVAIAAVNDATGAVNQLYRNKTHSLPATDLTAAKLDQAHQALQEVPTAKLTDQQRNQVAEAQEELEAAAQMLTVTTVTQAQPTTTPHYHQAAQKAIVAYHQLQTVKPVFTQVYQQPVADLATAEVQPAESTTPIAVAEVLPELPAAQPSTPASSAGDSLPQQEVTSTPEATASTTAASAP